MHGCHCSYICKTKKQLRYLLTYVASLPRIPWINHIFGMVLPWLTMVKQYGQQGLTMVYCMVEPCPKTTVEPWFFGMVQPYGQTMVDHG